MPKTDRGCGSETISKDGGVRKHRIDIRVSAAEKAYIQALADEHGMSVSELGLDCLLVDMPTTRDRSDHRAEREMHSKGLV